MRKIVLLLLVGLLVCNCGSHKKTTSRNKKSTVSRTHRTSSSSTRNQKPTERTAAPSRSQSSNNSTNTPANVSYGSPTEQYIAFYSGVAQDEMRLYGIPASITLAQGILESGSGKGRLSVEANNHFGIKCHDWTGARIYHDDDAKQECFRKYNDAKYSFRDHSLFLKERKRYYKLFDLDPDDYKGWARELRAAGYATDRKYPDKLIDLIERYRLYQYDDEVLGNVSSSRVVTTYETVTSISSGYVVQKGDTLYSISRKYNVTVEDLQRMNGLKGNDIKIGQVLTVSQ